MNTQQPQAQNSNSALIIGLSVGGALLVVLVVVVIVLISRKPVAENNQRATKVEERV
jgi:flagellar basal body-associated protein FliL